MAKKLSDRQLAANRENAQKSTGPRTAEGKRRSRMNAWKHGITARHVALNDESAPAFERLAYNLRLRFQPADGYEMEIVDNLAIIHWHMRRLRFIEGALLEVEICRPGVAGTVTNADGELLPSLAYRYLADHSNVLSLLNIQLNRLSRESARLHDTFLKMRSALPPLEPADSDPGQPDASTELPPVPYLQNEPVPEQPAALSHIAATTYKEKHEDEFSLRPAVALARAA